jgi:hypothetical protein
MELFIQRAAGCLDKKHGGFLPEWLEASEDSVKYFEGWKRLLQCFDFFPEILFSLAGPLLDTAKNFVIFPLGEEQIIVCQVGILLF